MATTIDPEGDPTYLAYERARQAGLSTLYGNQQTADQRAQADLTSNAGDLQRSGDQQVQANTDKYRAEGFGQSGLRARDEGQIRADIASKAAGLLTQYQRTTQDAGSTLAQALAQQAYEQQVQQLAARSRLTTDNATAGVGL